MKKTYIALIIVLFILFVPLRWKNGPKYSMIYSYYNDLIKLSHKAGIVYLNKEKGYEMLKILHKVLNEYNLFFWLSEGTALGFKRDNDFIEWDDDIDIGMWLTDREKFLKCLPELERHGFYLTVVGLDNTFYSLIYKGEKLDIDFTGKGIQCRANSSAPDGEICDVILPYLKQFDKIRISGLTYNIPTTAYIEKLYGPSWRTPIRGYKPQ